MNLNESKVKFLRFVLLAFSYFIAFELTLLIKSQMHLSTVESIALIGFTFSFFPFDFLISKEDFSNIFYSGSFLTMASAEIFSKLFWIILCSLIAALIYKKSRQLFIGFGGRLGSITFTSSSIALLIHFLKGLI